MEGKAKRTYLDISDIERILKEILDVSTCQRDIYVSAPTGGPNP